MRYNDYRAKWEASRNDTIPDGWHIHHLDGNRANNDVDNLICVSRSLHADIHKVQWERYENRRDWRAWRLLQGKQGTYKGRPCTWKDAISEAKKGKRPGSAKYFYLDTVTGVFYETYKEVAELLNIKERTARAWLDGQCRNKSHIVRV